MKYALDICPTFIEAQNFMKQQFPSEDVPPPSLGPGGGLETAAKA